MNISYLALTDGILMYFIFLLDCWLDAKYLKMNYVGHVCGGGFFCNKARSWKDARRFLVQKCATKSCCFSCIEFAFIF